MDVCRWCAQGLDVCRQPVDDRWPAAAQAAFALADLHDAATCMEGQTWDLRRTGWCWDRARFHRDWTGEGLTDEERKGVKPL